jgi:hypothetical protein
VEQPFYSLEPFEETWQVGMGIAMFGGIVILFAFGTFFSIMRASAEAADDGFGTLTILEVLADKGRDTGFLIQGKRHFGLLDVRQRSVVVSARLRGVALVLAAALWFVVGFGLAESGELGAAGQELQGFLPRFLRLTLGSRGAPGSCASLIASVQTGN